MYIVCRRNSHVKRGGEAEHSTACTVIMIIDTHSACSGWYIRGMLLQPKYSVEHDFKDVW